MVPESSIPTRNCESTIGSVVAESPSSGHLARGQCALAATVPLGGAPSWRLGAGGLLPPPPSPPPAECPWQWAAPGRAESELAPARRSGRARRLGQSLKLLSQKGPWALPFEASRGRGPGSAQFARGCQKCLARQLGKQIDESHANKPPQDVRRTCAVRSQQAPTLRRRHNPAPNRCRCP